MIVRKSLLKNESEKQIVMTKPEEDFDAVPIVDWRGNCPPNLLEKPENAPENAATECSIVVKNESWMKAPAPAGNAPPLYYELSDSDGTPIRPRRPFRSLAERRAAAAVKPPPISSKLNANADVVTLDSDSDEEISPSVTSVGKVDKLSQPRTQADLPHNSISLEDEGKLGWKPSGTMVKLAGTVPQGGLLDNLIFIDDECTVGGSKFSGNPFKLAETISQEHFLEKAISVEIEGCLVGSTSSRTALPSQGEIAAAVQTCDLPLRSTGDVRFSRDASSTVGNTLHVVQELDAAMQNSLIAGDALLLQTASGFRKRPSFSVGDSDQPDAAQGVISTQQSLCEENQWSSPLKPACEVLVLSDDDISPSTKNHILWNLGQLREPIARGGSSGRSRPSLGNEEIRTFTALNKIDEVIKATRADLADHHSLKTIVPSTSLGSVVVNPCSTTQIDVSACDNYAQTTCGSGKLASCAAEGLKLLGPAQEAGLGALFVYVPEEENRRSSLIRPMVEILTSDDDGCNSEPEWLRDHEPPSPMRSRRSGGSLSHNYRDEECSEQFLPDLRGNGEVRDHDACQKRPSRDESHENHKTTISSSAIDGPKMMAPVPGAVRSCLGAVKDSVPEENKRSFPDHPVFDLTSDNDGCISEPEWMRERNSPRVSWGQGSGADSHGLGNKRSSLQIPGLESPENIEYTVCPRGNDVEAGEELLGGAKVKRKRRRISGAAAERRALDDASNWDSAVSNSQRISKARKGPLSVEELAAKEAQKQREWELKKARQEEEKRRKQEEKEELKRQKAEATEKRKLEKELEKENDKWRKGKFALQNTTVHLDNKVIQMKELGPLLLRQLGDKHYKFEIGSNPIQNSVVWKMKRPAADSQMDSEGLGSQADYLINSQFSNSQLALEEVEMDYVVIVIQGEDFADWVGKNTLLERHSGVRKQYPKHYICYIINGLMKNVRKKEHQQSKSSDQTWTRPNVEQALAEFITHHPKVHSRLCIDECEIADLIIGLTRGLAECSFKQKLTSISVKANGEHVSKSDPNKDIIKKNIWLKFLVALPKINGAIAIAIANQYPTMRSLLDAYLDRRRPEHEKELLLQDLVKETSVGVSRKIGPHFSKCIYRILMAKDGDLSTEDVQDGADHFS